MSTIELETEPKPEGQSPLGRVDRFTQSSVGFHDGKRGINCVAAPEKVVCTDGGHVAGSSPRLVGKSGEHEYIIQLVSDLYEGKGSSWLPDDIRRDRAEVETATGFDRAAGYGEVVLGHFIDMLDTLGAHAGQQFYDLGSGLGQLVFTAGLLGMDATGIEVVKQRHEQACAAVQLAEAQDIGQNYGSINFVHGSFYDLDFSDADIVFVNSVLFSDEMMGIIAQKSRSMKQGSRIISYLSVPDIGKDSEQIGTWFRRLQTIILKTTFSTATPWKSYVAVGTHEGTGAADQEVVSAAPLDLT